MQRNSSLQVKGPAVDSYWCAFSRAGGCLTLTAQVGGSWGCSCSLVCLTLLNVCERMQGSVVGEFQRNGCSSLSRWVWAEGGTNPDLEQSLDVGGFGYPVWDLTSCVTILVCLFPLPLIIFLPSLFFLLCFSLSLPLSPSPSLFSLSLSTPSLGNFPA